jgi:hypothetical protein
MTPTDKPITIPAGRIQSLIREYEHELEKVGEDTPEGRVYKRVRRDLRRAIEPEHEGEK